MNRSQIPIVQIRKQRLRDLSHLPKINPSPFCSEPELLAVAPWVFQNLGPGDCPRPQLSGEFSHHEVPSVISSNSAYHTPFSQVEYPGILHGLNGMEPTERKPVEVEGNRMVEDGQNWNVKTEAVSSPLVRQGANGYSELSLPFLSLVKGRCVLEAGEN